MDKNWVKIYSSVFQHQVSLVMGMLEENNIRSVQVNKKDSSYTAVGEIELYVQKEDVVKSKYLLSKKEL